MKKITIDEDNLERLEENSKMLLQIRSFIYNFCAEDDTTVMGVLRLLAEYHDLKSEHYWSHLEHHESKQNLKEE